MNITLNIEAGTPLELQEAIAGLAGILGGSSAPVPTEPEKPKRQAKQETKAEKVAEADPVDKPKQDAQNDGTGEDENIPTVVELRAKAQEIGADATKKPKIKDLLGKYECKSISDVPEAKRAAFMAELEAL